MEFANYYNHVRDFFYNECSSYKQILQEGYELARHHPTSAAKSLAGNYWSLPLAVTNALAFSDVNGEIFGDAGYLVFEGTFFGGVAGAVIAKVKTGRDAVNISRNGFAWLSTLFATFGSPLDFSLSAGLGTMAAISDLEQNKVPLEERLSA